MLEHPVYSILVMELLDRRLVLDLACATLAMHLKCFLVIWICNNNPASIQPCVLAFKLFKLMVMRSAIYFSVVEIRFSKAINPARASF